jgi:hypothetical protein
VKTDIELFCAGAMRVQQMPGRGAQAGILRAYQERLPSFLIVLFFIFWIKNQHGFALI